MIFVHKGPCILLMMSQSIADDVINVLYASTTVTPACKKLYKNSLDSNFIYAHIHSRSCKNIFIALWYFPGWPKWQQTSTIPIVNGERRKNDLKINEIYVNYLFDWLTGPWGISVKFQITYVQANFNDWWLRYLTLSQCTLAGPVYTGMPLECHWLTKCTLEHHWENLVETAPHWNATGET